MSYETVEMIVADRERLRAEVELATMRVGSLTAEVEAQRQQISALVAEVERLKSEVAERGMLIDSARESVAARQREIDAARQDLHAQHKRADAAEAEVERLTREARDSRRAALEEAAGIAERIATGRTSEVFCSMVAAAIRAAAKEEK